MCRVSLAENPGIFSFNGSLHCCIIQDGVTSTQHFPRSSCTVPLFLLSQLMKICYSSVDLHSGNVVWSQAFLSSCNASDPQKSFILFPRILLSPENKVMARNIQSLEQFSKGKWIVEKAVYFYMCASHRWDKAVNSSLTLLLSSLWLLNFCLLAVLVMHIHSHDLSARAVLQVSIHCLKKAVTFYLIF